MREIVFDTETTGLNPLDGHRLVEFAGVELVNRMPTGRSLHFHFNPERQMPREAEQVHGLGDAFLADKPLFAERASDIVAFMNDAMLVAHNARFDYGFLNAELDRAGLGPLDDARMIDTLDLARKRFPGAKHSLDALCARFGIDRSGRVVHGALIDARLLAEVYVELTGGRQIGFDLSVAAGEEAGGPASTDWPLRTFSATPDEKAAHLAFIKAMQNAVWSRVGG